jgi:phosphopantothenoylcysteine decarboxylase/phosphopantothenate--cysteine ligase
MNVLITAGPTREHIDPVRYISNESSGLMGFALAEAAHAVGANVTLIAGPVDLETPKGVTRIDVVSCDDMRKHVIRHAKKADVIIMAAAVADASPQRRSKKKLKKPLKQIKLIPTPDILAELGKTKRDDQTIIGFALETGSLLANARKKLKSKHCDWIVANTHRSLGSSDSKATLIPARGKAISIPLLAKHDLAMLILSHVLA